jgi:hypothetical protein
MTPVHGPTKSLGWYMRKLFPVYIQPFQEKCIEQRIDLCFVYITLCRQWRVGSVKCQAVLNLLLLV